MNNIAQIICETKPIIDGEFEVIMSSTLPTAWFYVEFFNGRKVLFVRKTRNNG